LGLPNKSILYCGISVKPFLLSAPEKVGNKAMYLGEMMENKVQNHPPEFDGEGIHMTEHTKNIIFFALFCQKVLAKCAKGMYNDRAIL
jgi:hypothetical protein